MKLVVFCLFAVCCYAMANTSGNDKATQERKKFNEIIKNIDRLKASLQLNGRMLYTPPNNITDCCCLSALRCFRKSLQDEFNIERSHRKFYKSLAHNITEEGLNFPCDSGNDSTCQLCDTHPKENATEFFNRLKTLFQRATTRLTD